MRSGSSAGGFSAISTKRSPSTAPLYSISVPPPTGVAARTNWPASLPGRKRPAVKYLPFGDVNPSVAWPSAKCQDHSASSDQAPCVEPRLSCPAPRHPPTYACSEASAALSAARVSLLPVVLDWAARSHQSPVYRPAQVPRNYYRRTPGLGEFGSSRHAARPSPEVTGTWSMRRALGRWAAVSRTCRSPTSRPPGGLARKTAR